MTSIISCQRILGTGRTIRKLMGGGRNENNSCMPINPKKSSCYDLKNSYKEIPAARKFPSPLHNVSNGPSLIPENVSTNP